MKKMNYLSLGGLFVALHVVFILLSRFLPGSSLLLVIFLPLLSAIYTLKFDKKEVAMFVVATFFLCLIFEPVSTCIYVIPALMCGVIYGALRKKKIKELTMVYISSISHFTSLLISFLFIGLMFKEIDFFDIFSVFISKRNESFYACVYLFLIVLGVIEAFILHLICDDELEKIGYEKVEEETSAPNWIVVGSVISIISYIVCYFIMPVYTIYTFPFVIAFAIPIIVEFIKANKRKWIYMICGIFGFFSVFLLTFINPICYPILMLVIVSPIIVEKIVRVLYTFCLKCSNKKENIIE